MRRPTSKFTDLGEEKLMVWLYIKLGLDYRFLEISCSPEGHGNLKDSTEGERNFDANRARGAESFDVDQHEARPGPQASHKWKTWDVTPQPCILDVTEYSITTYCLEVIVVWGWGGGGDGGGFHLSQDP